MIADRVGSFTLFSKKIEFTLAFSRPHNLRFYEYFELRGCLRCGAVRCDFRLCLVCVKVFLKNILFFGNAIFRKGKYFHVFGCHKIRFTEN